MPAFWNAMRKRHWTAAHDQLQSEDPKLNGQVLPFRRKQCQPH
jgi:hypothetical protein